ncbi:MAG: DNA repair protein RecO [Bacteroidales bacterium]|nr:DNA repair protein RecO [Bacteroidales bacterium]
MIQTTRLIVFHAIKYRESDLLVYAYTCLHGRQSYLLRKARTVGKHNTAARIFPLSILDAEIYYKSGAAIQYIKSLQPAADLSGIRSDLHKSGMALFLGEILYKSIKEEETNLPLYHFLVESIQALNDMEYGVANFHLHFLAQYCARLGYAPFPNYDSEQKPLFDMAKGMFVARDSVSDFLFSQGDSQLLSRLSALQVSEAANLPLNGTQRHQFVTSMIHYLHYHLGFSLDIKSPEVLRQLFQ